MEVFNKKRKLTPSWDLVRPSTSLVQQYFWQVFYLSYVPGVLLFSGLLLLGEDPAKSSDLRLGLGAIFALVGLIYAILAFPGITYLQLKAAEGKDVTAMECIRKGLPHLPALVGTGLLSIIVVLAGLCALIIPGLLLLRGFALAQFYVIDKNLSPADALRKSYADSVPVSGWIWGLIGVELVFSVISTTVGKLGGIGLLLSLAIGYIYVFAPAIRYAEVVKKHKIPALAPVIKD